MTSRFPYILNPNDFAIYLEDYKVLECSARVPLRIT